MGCNSLGWMEGMLIGAGVGRDQGCTLIPYHSNDTVIVLARGIKVTL